MKKVIVGLSAFVFLVGSFFPSLGEDAFTPTSKTTVFTNSALIYINGRHDNPIVLNSFILTFSSSITNTFELSQIRPLLTNGVANGLTVTNILALDYGTNYTSFTYNFEGAKIVLLKDDILKLTNTLSNPAVFTYNYDKK